MTDGFLEEFTQKMREKNIVLRGQCFGRGLQFSWKAAANDARLFGGTPALAAAVKSSLRVLYSAGSFEPALSMSEAPPRSSSKYWCVSTSPM